MSASDSPFGNVAAGLMGVPAAPGTKDRHAASDPEETLRKELTQCQYCFKSRNEEGVKLMKCTGCKIDSYCSRECQKKAWPMHKERCRMTQRIKESNGDTSKHYQALRAFTKKHRPVFHLCGVHALEVITKPQRAEREVLVIYLRLRPGSARSETSFYATDAEVLNIDILGPEKAAEMRGQLKQTMADNVKSGVETCGFFVVLRCLDPQMINVSPVVFQKDVPNFVLPQLVKPWKEMLITTINQGIVI